MCVCVCLSLTKSKTRNEFYLRFLTLFASHTIGLLTLTRVSVCRSDMEGCVKLCRLVLLEEWVKLELNLKAIWNFKDDKYRVFIQEKSKWRKQKNNQEVNALRCKMYKDKMKYLVDWQNFYTLTDSNMGQSSCLSITPWLLIWWVKRTIMKSFCCLTKK